MSEDDGDADAITAVLFDQMTMMDDTMALNQAQLIDIGCAFAPPPHNTLHPQKVVSAQMVQYNSKEMQIALAVQDLGGAVAQVLIVVPLEEPSDSRQQDEYLQQLHQTAQEIIQRREWESDRAEETQNKELYLREDAYGDDLPLWWTYANTNFLMEDEAALLKKLLNERDLVLPLFRRQTKNNPNEVEMARVASIGPSGIIVRAALVDTSDETETLAVPFEREATSAEELRAYVLALLEEPEEPAVTEDKISTEEEETPVFETTTTTTDVEQSDDLETSSSTILVQKQKDFEFQRRLMAARLHYETKATPDRAEEPQSNADNEYEFIVDRWGIHRRNW
eukprot:CAMPEP_0194230024 /NCGR_PEP_ID=MMETSP0156-20130528/44195_1 /TAXON_ID=33649 /ORGANISM="Thalassionema nitzschioides, Strain L26-B" /LENGTH=337 /DNA_ID=CAMNT_0038962597 /DNA_START=220 /DNA_END=1233 /DNA_ORIENTATION=-